MRRSLALLALWAAVGCARGPAEAAVAADIELPPAAERPDFAHDAPGFLRALLPSPHGAVRVTYDVTGPAGMEGTLTVTSRPGGERHEAWTINVELPTAEPMVVQGSRIVTPDLIWTDAVEGAAVVRRAPLGELARAYADLDPGLQSLVAFRVQQWHQQVARGRVEHPGETEHVLGRACLSTRVASHRVCVWEDTGLILSYAGDAFRIVARVIETDVDVSDTTFEIPGGQRAVDDETPIDGHAAIVRLAAGDYADLTAWIQPSLPLG